ncbi:hypothetical protein Y1Q_0001473 [Alligator mississippiensis]|uniref:ribonuclease H n=1 Tax=Alligator mississippiensis TaxID=8496 RepID=A0A151M9L9_ALLMI|nr:hypothetical protein Y1Q_0001473 [Alligator mississippiensis]
MIEDVLPDLSRAKVFTVCKVKNGFRHVELDKSSSHLTTFSTPFGRYCWLKIPMGISPALEIFQQKLNQELEGLPGIKIVADDILIIGEEDKEEAIHDHDAKLQQLLNRCQERNIKLNADKIQLRRTEVPYIGHLLVSHSGC